MILRKPFSTLIGLALLTCIDRSLSQKVNRENECAAYCFDSQVHNLFKYETGKSYVYRYETQVKTMVTGNTEENAATTLGTTAVISVLTPCEFSLQLRNSSLLVDGSGAGPYALQLDARPLRFWFSQGRIQRLCPGFDADPEFVLNVKRGLLSAFQTSNTLPESLHYETDISGLCRTRSTTTATDPETGVRVSKFKNLAHCGASGSGGRPVRGSLHPGFDLQSALKSEQSCVQDYSADSLILSRSLCEEVHLLKPFSQGAQGASILVRQQLTYVSTHDSGETHPVIDDHPISGSFTTLVYATPSTALLDSSESGDRGDDIEASLLEPQFTALAKSLRGGVSGSSPELYFEFLTQLRTVSAPVLSKLLRGTQGLERKLLLSLIAQSGTDESLGFLAQQHDNHDLSDADIVGLLSEIQAYQAPSAFSVEKLHELSEKDAIRVEALLPLGSLIHRYCSSVNCQADETVRTVIRALDHSLPAFCRTYTNKDTLVTSAILKSIGNAGIYTSNLKACMFEPIGHIEVRLNAIRALRRVPCSDVAASNAIGLFMNAEENVEIRLEAYLICMQCANSTLLTQVLTSLPHEPVHQVRSFVLSHLTNLQESTSSSSHSIRLRQLLRNKPLTSFYSSSNEETSGLNPLKFSTHFSYSFGIPTFQRPANQNGGFFESTNQDSESPSNQINVESNVIYSNSYFPSSLYMNLSANLFEKEVQLFEFGTRLQGLESRIESLFGKNGYFPDESVMKLLKSFRSDHASSVLDSRLNGLRSETLSSRVGSDKLDLDDDRDDLDDDLEDGETKREYLSYYVRTGGQDVKFGHFEKGLKQLMAKVIGGGVLGATRDKNGNLTNIHSHQVYMNNSVSISSISGLPLLFHIDLVNSVNFNYNYDFDWSDLFKGKNVHLDLHFNPSVHLQFKSFLGVNLEYVERRSRVVEDDIDGDNILDDGVEEVVKKIKNGLELKAKVATESFVDVKFALQKGSVVDFKINVPRKRHELLDISTRLLLHRGQETLSSTQPATLTSRAESYPSRREAYESYESCWPEPVSDMMGLELCSKLSAFNYSRLDAFNHSRQSSDAIVTAQFPLTGDFNWRLSLNKVDSFNRYELSASNGFNMINSKSTQSFVFNFNTPGSQIDRKIHLSLSLDHVTPGVKLRAQCPLGNMELSGKYSAKDNHKALTVLANLNGREVINVDANLVVKNGGNTRYEPSLVVFYKNVLFVDIKGHIDYIVGVKYNADLSVKGLTQRPIDISGDLVYTSNRTSLTLHMNSDQFGYFKIHGTLKSLPHGSFLAKGHVNYDIGKSAQAHQGHFLLKFDQYEKASLYKSNTHFKLESTQYENLNLDLRHGLQTADHLFDSRLEFTVFGNPWSSRALYRNFVQRDGRGGREGDGGDGKEGGAKPSDSYLTRSFELLASLRCEKKHLHYKTQALHETTSTNTTSLLLAQLNDATQLLASYSLGESARRGGTSLEARLASPWAAARARAEYLPYDENTIDATLTLEWSRVHVSQHQLRCHLSYVFDPSTSKSKLSANFVLGNEVDVNSASVGADSLQYQLDAEWTLDSIHFNIYMPNSRHISGELIYTSSDTRGGDFRRELLASLKLNTHDAVQLSLLYSRDGRSRQELIATKLAWKHNIAEHDGNQMAEAASVDEWKRVEWNIGFKMFEKINMELVLPEYYFHVNLDVHYLGLYSPNSLRSELSWGASRQTVSLIQIESQFQLDWAQSHLNVTVLTPFKSWETLTLDSRFRLSNQTQDVEMELQATGHIPSHEIHLYSSATYNPYSNFYSISFQSNNTIFSVESLAFSLNHFENGTAILFSCEPGLDNQSLVRFQYEIVNTKHSGTVAFFTPFPGLRFVSSDLSFDQRLTSFSAKITPFDVVRGRLLAKGDYALSYALDNQNVLVPNIADPTGATVEQRFDLSLSTPHKELKRLSLLYMNSHASEYRLEFTLNDDVSFANVNVTNSNRLPFDVSARVDIGSIISDLRLKLAVRANELAIFVAESGEQLFDLNYEGANNYVVSLKFRDNLIHVDLELNDNSMNFAGNWNNYTMSADSEYSITYKDLWFDCLVKARIVSNSFKNDYTLLVSHDSDNNNINNNVFNTDIRVNQLSITHKLIIQMESLLHNKWINSITVNNNSIVNEYHQIFMNANKTDYSYLMNVVLNKTVSSFNLNYSIETPGVLFGLNNVDLHISIPELSPFKMNYVIDYNFNTKFELFVTNAKYFLVNLENKDLSHFDLTIDSTYLPKIQAVVDLETPHSILVTFRKSDSNYSCVLHYDVKDNLKANLTLDLYKNEGRDLALKVSYDFSDKNYLFDFNLNYNFSSVYSNSVSIRYSSVYLSKYQLEARSEFELLRDISVVLELDFKKSFDRVAKFNVVLNKEKFLRFDIILSKPSNKIHLNAALNSNMINSEQNNYTFNVGVETINSHDYLIELKYTFNDKLIALNSKLIYNNNSILIEFVLKTPIHNYELVFLKFNIRWNSMNNYNLIFRLQKNTVITHLNSSILINNENLNYNGFIYLTSPHEIFNNVHTDFNISFHNGLNFNVKLENINKTIQFVCANSISSTLLNIYTPYPGFENITLSSRISNENSNLFIYKSNVQWVKLSFEKTNVKNTFFVMELPSYVFINKIEMKINLDRNITVNISILKFDKHVETFNMEFTGGEFKCTIDLPSLQINSFNANVKFSVNSARTFVKIYVNIVSDVEPILFLKINYDERQNFYLNLHRPMRNTSYVTVVGSYQTADGNLGGKYSGTKTARDYVLAFDLTEIDKRFKYNVVVTNSTLRVHNRTNLLYVLAYKYDSAGIAFSIVKETLRVPFLTLNLNFDPNAAYDIELHVNNTDNYFKYFLFNLNFNNKTNKGHFAFDYLNKVKSYIELGKGSDGLINLETKLILNFDSLVNVKTKIALNKTEIIPRVIDFDYNYNANENYVEFNLSYEKMKLSQSELILNYKLNNKVYSFRLGNNSLVIQSDILELDIYLTKTNSAVYFDFESFNLNFEHNLESPEKYVKFNLTTINAKNLFFNVNLSPDNRISIELEHMKYKVFFKLGTIFVEEFHLANRNSHYSLNLSISDEVRFYYNIIESKEMKDLLMHYTHTSLFNNLLDECLIELHPSSGTKSAKTILYKSENSAKNAIVVDLKNLFFKLNYNQSSSVQYTNKGIFFNNSILTGDLILHRGDSSRTKLPTINLSGTVLGHSVFIKHDVNTININVTNVERDDIIFNVYKSEENFSFVHKVVGNHINLSLKPDNVHFLVNNTGLSTVNVEIEFDTTKRFLNATFTATKVDLDINIVSQYSLKENTVDFQLKFSSNNEPYLDLYYNGNLFTENIFLLYVPNFVLKFNHSHLNDVRIFSECHSNKFAFEWKNSVRSSPTIEKLFLLVHVIQNKLIFQIENDDEMLAVLASVEVDKVESKIKLSSKKSKNINFEIKGENGLFLGDIENFKVILECSFVEKVIVTTNIEFETRNRSKKNFDVQLITDEASLLFDLKSNALKNVFLKFDFDKNSVNGQIKINEKFVNLVGHIIESKTIELNLTSSEFSAVNMFGSFEKGSSIQIQLNSNQNVNYVVLKYNMNRNSTVINLIGYLNKEQVLSFDFTYDLRQQMKHKLVYLNVKYKNKQVLLIENKFNAREYFFNYKLATNVLQSKLHLDYKFQVHINLNELKNGNKLKMFLEFPELLRVNKTLYFKFNPQGKQYIVQVTDLIDVVSNANETTIKLNLFSINWVSSCQYANDQIVFDFRPIQTQILQNATYHWPYFNFEMNHLKNGHFLEVDMKLKGQYGSENITLLADLKLSPSDCNVAAEFNGKQFNLTLMKTQDNLAFILSSDLLTTHLTSSFNKSAIKANYSMSLLNQIYYKFAFVWDEKQMLYHFNDFRIDIMLDKKNNVFQFSHINQQNHAEARIDNFKKSLNFNYFGYEAQIEFDENFIIQFFDDSTKSRFSAALTHKPEKELEISLLLSTVSERNVNYTISFVLNRSDVNTNLEMNLLDTHIAKFELLKQRNVELSFDYIRQNSLDDFQFMSKLISDRTSLTFNSNLVSKNISTSLLRVQLNKNIHLFDLNLYDSLLLNYDFVHNHTFNVIVFSRDLNSSFNIDFDRNNIYLNVNLLSYSYEFEYEILANKVLLKYKRFYQSTLMQNIHIDYHYIRDFYKLKIVIYSLIGLNVELDSSISFNNKNINGALRYNANKIENSLLFKIEKLELAKNVEVICKLPLLRLKNYRINFSVDAETVTLTANEINNKKVGNYFHFEILNSATAKCLTIKSPVQLNKNIFVNLHINVNVTEKSLVLNSSYIMDTTIVFGINTTNRFSNSNFNSYIGIITPHAPYETVTVKLNMPLTKNITKILYSLNLGENSYEIFYDKLNADRRKSHAIYQNVIVWNFNLNNNNLLLNLNMHNNSINITSINLTNYNMTLINAHKNLTIVSNLNIAMTNNSNYYNGMNQFTFNVNYARDAVRLNYTFNFVLANELNQNKKLLLDIIYPNNTILFSFEFKFESIYKNAFKIYTNIFKPISLLIKNNLSNKKDLSTHCEAKYSNNDLFINFEHRLSNTHDINSNITITINKKTLSLNIFNKFVSKTNLDIRIGLVTPLEKLDSGSFYFKINTTNVPNVTPNYFGGVLLSGRDIISLSLYSSDDGTYWISLHNDYLPVKLAYLYNISDLHDLKLFTYISWNQVQQYGLKFSLHNEFSDDRYLTVEIFLPYHTVKLDLKVNRRNKLLYVFLVKVGDLNYGFDVLVQSDTKLNVYLNYNIIKLNLVNSFDKLGDNHFIKHGILINIVNNLHGTDRKVKLLINNQYSDEMSRVTVEFDHWKLSHGIILQLYDSASTSRLTFTYSDSPNETFFAELFSETTSGSSTVTKFLIQHPPTNLYYVFNSERSESNLNSQVNLHYRNNRNVLNNIGLAYVCDDREKQVAINGNKNSLNLGYDSSSGWIQINERNQLRFRYSSLSNMNLFFGDLKYSFFSQFSARELLVQMGESINGHDFIDFLSLLKLNHSSLLYGKVVYSGRILENLQRHYVHQYNDINVATARILDGFYDLTQTDLVSTLYGLYERVVVSMDEVVNSTFDVLKQIAGDCVNQQDLLLNLSFPNWSGDHMSLPWDVYQTLSAILKGYLHNVFQVFMFDVSRLFSFTDDVKSFIETSKRNIHSLYSHIDALKGRIKQNTRLILTSTRLKLLELQSLTIQWLRDAEEQVVLTAQTLAATVQKKAITLMQYVYDVKDTVQTFAFSVYDLAIDFVTMFIEIEEVKFMIKYAYDIYHEYVNFGKLHEWIVALFQLVVEDLQRNFSDLTTYILSLCENKYVQSIRNFCSILYYKICWSWTYLDVTTRIESALYSRLESFIYFLIFSSTHKSFSRYELSLDPPRLEFLQSLPPLLRWDGFDSLPRLKSGSVMEMLPSLDGSGLMADVENFKYSVYTQFSSMGGLAVSDKTLALLMGDQVLTFDGKLVHVPPSMGEGVYVLSYELQDEKFVLLMEYNRKNEKTIHFWTGADRVSIRMGTSQSPEVLLNKAPLELPYELSLNAHIVSLDGGSRVRISYEDHLSVLCQMERDICIVQVSPWLYGKTVGLLGNFDYESYNDMAYPNGTLSTDSQSFLASWKLPSDTRTFHGHESFVDKEEFDQNEASYKRIKEAKELEKTEINNEKAEDEVNNTNKTASDSSTSTETELQDGPSLTDLSQMMESNGSLSLHSLLVKLKSGPKEPNHKSGPKGPNISGSAGPSFLSYNKVAQCESYFLRSRVPSLCYNRLSRDAFYSLCLRSGDPCRTIAAFIAMCREVDFEVQLMPPSHCVQCQMNNRTLHQGQSVTVHSGDNRQQRDIVFLVNSHENDCMGQINMTAVLHHMLYGSQPEAAKSRDLRFGFVVFNNNKYDADIQTYSVGQRLWTSDVTRSVSTFERILSDKCPHSSCADVTTTFEALKFVTKLSFRPGAARSVVLLQCAPCSDKQGYSDTLAMLLESSLQLHILSPQSLLNAGGRAQPLTPTGPDTLGVDFTGAYTEGGYRNVPANGGQMHHAPRDLCTSLALSTLGSHFSIPPAAVWTQLVLQLKAPHTLSTKASTSSSKAPFTSSPTYVTGASCQVCDCVAGDDALGRLACYRCGPGLSLMDAYDGDLDGTVPVDYPDDYMDPKESLDVLLS